MPSSDSQASLARTSHVVMDRVAERRGRCVTNEPTARAPKSEQWIEALKKHSVVVASKSGAPSYKQSVQTIVEHIHHLNLCRGTGALLERNALLACYWAKFAPSPHNDSSAKARSALLASHKSLQRVLPLVSDVLAFLEKHNYTSAKAMSCGIESEGRKVRSISRAGHEKTDQLESLLRQWRVGLVHIQDFDHPIHVTADDFCYGPFEFYGRSLYEWDFKGADINQTGLMFHLSYLFRYFTCGEGPHENIDVRRDGVVEVHGQMLKCGKPYTDLVAPLVNAVFETSFTPLHVKDRLRDLSRRSKGSRREKRPVFRGWPSQE